LPKIVNNKKLNKKYKNYLVKKLFISAYLQIHVHELKYKYAI